MRCNIYTERIQGSRDSSWFAKSIHVEDTGRTGIHLEFLEPRYPLEDDKIDPAFHQGRPPSCQSNHNVSQTVLAYREGTDTTSSENCFRSRGSVIFSLELLQCRCG